MVRRNLSEKLAPNLKFICFTDSPEDIILYEQGIESRPLPGKLKGWWNKLYLFKEGHFEDGDRIVYFDLDTIIVGGLDEIIKYDGEFAILRDFYRSNGLQSSVMAWEANNHLSGIWDRFLEQAMPNLKGGDQEFIEKVFAQNADILWPDIWQDIYPEQFVSYKVDCRSAFPKGAKVVIFHGEPRPHEVLNGWVPQVWKIGGGTSLELEIVCNTDNDQLIKNIKSACALPLPWLQGGHAVHDKHAVIIGGGPSLKNQLAEIQRRQEEGQVVFSTNNTWKFLLENGIEPDYHVMSDARPENADFIPDNTNDTEGLYASQCAPEVFKFKSTIWHPFLQGIKEVIGPDERNYAVVGGGTTTGLKAIAIAFILGYRKFHLYGFDSSYEEGNHHAYKQALNDSSKVIEVIVNGIKFETSPWMVTQVDDFKELAPILVNDEGCEITIHGNGLLPYVATLLVRSQTEDTEIELKDGFYWPSKDIDCREAVLREVGDIDKIITYCKRKGTVIQAGGNVGLWALRLAKSFKDVLTFEPDALNHSCLEKNINGALNIYPFHAALGDKKAFASLEKNPLNSGAHYIIDGKDFEVMTIDGLGLKECDLIQLDIEGYELKALKGALLTIRKFRPTIVIEDKGLGKRYDNDNASDWLKAHGYIQVAKVHNDSIFVPKLLTA